MCQTVIILIQRIYVSFAGTKHVSTQNLRPSSCRYLWALLYLESYILQVLHHALKLFSEHSLLEIWLDRHSRKQNSIDRLLHSPLLNNSAAVSMQEDIKKKGRDEKRLGLYSTTYAMISTYHYICLIVIIFILFFFLSSVLYSYSSYYIPPSLVFLVWLLPHSSKTHPSKYF